MSTLAERIKERMQIMGLTNAQLAKAAHVKQPTAFNWGSGKTKNIKGEPLLRAAQALGVTPIWLATGSDKSHKAAKTDIRLVGESVPIYQWNPEATEWPFRSVTKEQYQSLSDPQRAEVEGFIKGLLLGGQLTRKSNGAHS